jgi:histone H3/H4
MLANEIIDILTILENSRLARRGGVERISVNIYDEVRNALKVYLTAVSNEP